MTFPESPCYVCKRPFTSINDGFIGANNYGNSLRHLSDIRNDPLIPRFINAVTHQYFRQFPKIFGQKYEEAVNIGQIHRDLIIDSRAHQHRLEKVMQEKPDKFLFMLCHDECQPSEIEPTAYLIDLPRIDTAEKAIEWTIHLSEKSWLNPKGWTKVLEDIFGRTSLT